MDNITADKTLASFHAVTFQDNLQVFITVIILAVFGVIGNGITLRYYMSKNIHKPVIWIILSLAKVDFLVCVLMFAAAVEIGVNVQIHSRILCKTIYFCDYGFVCSSIMILALVSVDRYRKICKPFGKQLTLRMSKYIVVILIVTSFTISSRAFVTYDVVEITLLETSTNVAIGYQCDTTDAADLEFVVGFFHYFDIIVVGAIFVVLVLAYSLILRSLYLHKERVKRIVNLKGRVDVKTADLSTSNELLTSQITSQTLTDIKDNCRLDCTVTKEHKPVDVVLPEPIGLKSDCLQCKYQYRNSRRSSGKYTVGKVGKRELKLDGASVSHELKNEHVVESTIDEAIQNINNFKVPGRDLDASWHDSDCQEKHIKQSVNGRQSLQSKTYIPETTVIDSHDDSSQTAAADLDFCYTDQREKRENRNTCEMSDTGQHKGETNDIKQSKDDASNAMQPNDKVNDTSQTNDSAVNTTQLMERPSSKQTLDIMITTAQRVSTTNHKDGGNSVSQQIDDHKEDGQSSHMPEDGTTNTKPLQIVHMAKLNEDVKKTIQPGANDRRVIRIRKYEIQTTIMMLFVSVGFLISFIPYFIASIGILYSSALDPYAERQPIKASTHLLHKCAFLNSVINPIVYFTFNNDFRHFIASFFRKSAF